MSSPPPPTVPPSRPTVPLTLSDGSSCPLVCPVADSIETVVPLASPIDGRSIDEYTVVNDSSPSPLYSTTVAVSTYSLLSLPNEILTRIFGHLPLFDRLNARQCHRLAQIERAAGALPVLEYVNETLVVTVLNSDEIKLARVTDRGGIEGRWEIFSFPDLLQMLRRFGRTLLIRSFHLNNDVLSRDDQSSLMNEVAHLSVHDLTIHNNVFPYELRPIYEVIQRNPKIEHADIGCFEFPASGDLMAFHELAASLAHLHCMKFSVEVKCPFVVDFIRDLFGVDPSILHTRQPADTIRTTVRQAEIMLRSDSNKKTLLRRELEETGERERRMTIVTGGNNRKWRFIVTYQDDDQFEDPEAERVQRDCD